MIKKSHLKVGKLGIFTAHEFLWVIHCEGEECELKLKRGSCSGMTQLGKEYLEIICFAIKECVAPESKRIEVIESEKN